MPAKNLYHDLVSSALVADGWTITHDPLTLSFGGRDLFVDLGAERPAFADEKGGLKIAVKVQSFLENPPVRDLQEAVGQFDIYRAVLAETEPDRVVPGCAEAGSRGASLGTVRPTHRRPPTAPPPHLRRDSNRGPLIDRTDAYRAIVLKIIAEYASYVPSHGQIEPEAIIDREHDHYEVMLVGWDGARRVHGCVINLDIRNGKVWIQHDGTSQPVVDELLEAGVPRKDIVLGFHPEEVRGYTEFSRG